MEINELFNEENVIHRVQKENYVPMTIHALSKDNNSGWYFMFPRGPIFLNHMSETEYRWYREYEK